MCRWINVIIVTLTTLVPNVLIDPSDGKWIVSVEWLVQCLREDSMVSPEPYEIDRDHKAAPQSSGAARRARTRLAEVGATSEAFNRHPCMYLSSWIYTYPVYF